MRIGRDLGAALTMGLSATTKHKRAEKDYAKRYDSHKRLVDTFNDAFLSASNSVQRMDGEYASARDSLLKSGAVKVDDEETINYGWYRPVNEAGAEDQILDPGQVLVGSMPAFGVAIGAPALTWTLVGTFGTAATGTAINALSGAAAGAATAAWLGRAATLGLAGMTAGRVALGPIAALSLPVQLAIGAKVAGNRERRAIKQFQDAKERLDKYDGIMSDLKAKLAEHDRRANSTSASLYRHAGQMETAAPGSEEALQAAARLDRDMQQAVGMLFAYAETASAIQEKLGNCSED